MKYLGLDTETLGLSPECAVIEVAIVEEDTEKQVPVDELPYRRWLIKPTEPFRAEAYALGMHTRLGLWDECQKYGLTANAVWTSIATYLFDYRLRELGMNSRGERHRAVVAGKNVAGFDLRFMPDSVTSQLHHRVLDPGSMFADPGDLVPPSLADILNRKLVHTALEDARDVVRAIRMFWKGM